MRKKWFILDIIILGSISIFLYVFNIRICPFYFFFKLPCPGCGLTRSIVSILCLDFNQSIQYNILGIPIILFFLFYFLLIILKKEDILNEIIFKHSRKLFFFGIILLLFVEYVNIHNNLLY